MYRLIFYIVLLFPFLISAQPFAEEQGRDTLKSGDVVVDIYGINNDTGQVFCHIFMTNTGFPTKSKQALEWKISPIKNGKVRIIFNNIPFGIYAITTHHDENMNDVMDKSFLGYPSEGFGISNNVTIVFAVPEFEECKFIHQNERTHIRIKMKYF